VFDKGIYAVITEKFCAERSSLEVLEHCLQAGVTAVQLREKELSKNKIYELALQWKKLTDSYETSFIINDHLDVAMAVGADGVHLGQADLPCSVARRLAPDMILGVSTHNYLEALQAEKDGASYINIGPIFSTQTKDGVGDGIGIEKINEISSLVAIPFTVMGGIKEENINQVVNAGARRVAMVTEITQSVNITEKIKTLNALI